MAFTLCDTCMWADTCMDAKYGLDWCPVYAEDDQTAEDDDEPVEICAMCGTPLPDTCRLLSHGNRMYSMVCESCWTKHKEEQV